MSRIDYAEILNKYESLDGDFDYERPSTARDGILSSLTEDKLLYVNNMLRGDTVGYHLSRINSIRENPGIVSSINSTASPEEEIKKSEDSLKAYAKLFFPQYANDSDFIDSVINDKSVMLSAEKSFLKAIRHSIRGRAEYTSLALLGLEEICKERDLI